LIVVILIIIILFALDILPWVYFVKQK
jgi:type II secretory pathway pseudopilin PulG